MSVTSNSSSGGVLWGISADADNDNTTQSGTFRAFDALTMVETWNSSTAMYDQIPSIVKFVTAVAANGKVAVAAGNALYVYALRGGTTITGKATLSGKVVVH